MKTHWSGIFPAVTTKFADDGSLDFAAMERHFEAQMDAGIHGMVTTGTLGENGSLSPQEKQDVLKCAVSASAGRIPVLAGIAETTTEAACRAVEAGGDNGADGFMVLPPMQYVSDWAETVHHFRTVARASERPIMIYNNPVAYGVDVTPEMFEELAEEPRFAALKESSDDVRRITEIFRRVGDRYCVFTGVDNLALESLFAGADGWVAGLVCAFPRETVVLYELIRAGRTEEARSLYRWFRPLLDLDVSTKLVQNIKLAESMVGIGTENVRPPRRPLSGVERERVTETIRLALESRMELPQIVEASGFAR